MPAIGMTEYRLAVCKGTTNPREAGVYVLVRSFFSLGAAEITVLAISPQHVSEGNTISRQCLS